MSSRSSPFRIRRLDFVPLSTPRASRQGGDALVGRTIETVKLGFGLHGTDELKLDYFLLRRGLLFISILLVIFAPMTRDPVAFGVGVLILPLLIGIVATPNMPAAIAYLLAWQWVEVFAQVILSSVNGEAMDSGLYGPNVARAYWYMMLGLVALACGFRAALQGLRDAPALLRVAHRNWRPSDLFKCYLISLLVQAGYGIATSVVPALDQQLEAVARIKIVVLFLLFASILSTRVGMRYLAYGVLIELGSGFGGLFSDFKSVFIILGVAAVGARIRWSNTLGVLLVVWVCVLMGLALFWTAVKTDYRQFATGSDDSQYIRSSLGDRYSYLGGKVASAGNIDWGWATQAMLSRLAYVDIFGSVIGVNEATPEGINTYPRQWQEAIEHITKPRFLFPDKAALSDTLVFARLALGNADEEMRAGTSISVGYMGENYADFGFPGMTIGIFGLAFIIGTMARYFMMYPLPLLMREGIVLALVYTTFNTGVEGSLPKVLGAAIMFFIIYAVAVKVAFPRFWTWLDERAALG